MLSDSVLIAVDVGNSRIKLGRFERAAAGELPEPSAALQLPLVSSAGEIEDVELPGWCKSHVGARAEWLVASVNRGAAHALQRAVAKLASASGAVWPWRQITYRDVPVAIDVDEPQRVGVDRLVAALAANRLRSEGRAVIIVDLGSAITVDRVEADGTFAGGAILPGMAMAARSLHERTDALPLVPVHTIHEPPPLGKSTVAAIRAGLFWGAVGATSELVDRLSAGLAGEPDVLVTGGGAARMAELIAARSGRAVRSVPHLILAGIALVALADGGGQAGVS